jgi:hypothetical protein
MNATKIAIKLTAAPSDVRSDYLPYTIHWNYTGGAASGRELTELTAFQSGSSHWHNVLCPVLFVIV